MEGLTRLVSESLARHGFDRPLDYRRLRWSRWFRCESAHSLLFVPSKPGVFALAEEIMEMGHVATAASAVPPKPSEAEPTANLDHHDFPTRSAPQCTADHVGADAFDRPASAASMPVPQSEINAPSAPTPEPRRMLAVSQFFDADDMAFTLDRMLTRTNPMRSRLASGRFFIRFVVIEDHSQRLSISAALNQWIANSAEKISGIGAHFATSLDLTDPDAHVATAAFPNHVATAASAVPPKRSEAELTKNPVGADAFVRPVSAASMIAPPAHSVASPQLDSGAASNLHCPSPLPSGF